jgi:hypothetical protein
MLSRRIFFGIFAGALSAWPAAASMLPGRRLGAVRRAASGSGRQARGDVSYSDEEIVVVDGWVLRRDEAEQAFDHAD